MVLEHAGWPDGGEPGHFSAWRDGLARLAELDNVHCKISGLPMALHTMDGAALRPWIDACLETFGADRAFFGSNFPVDSLFGGYARLVEAYLDATRPGAADAQELVSRRPPLRNRDPPEGRPVQPCGWKRLTVSATIAGLLPPSISIVDRSTAWTPPPAASFVSCSTVVTRTRDPTGTGAGKRTLFRP